MEVGTARFWGDLTARIFALLIGLLLMLPSLYKLCSYGAFRYHAVAAVGIVENPMRGWAGFSARKPTVASGEVE